MVAPSVGVAAKLRAARTRRNGAGNSPWFVLAPMRRRATSATIGSCAERF